MLHELAATPGCLPGNLPSGSAKVVPASMEPVPKRPKHANPAWPLSQATADTTASAYAEPPQQGSLVVMLLDVQEEQGGKFHLWGLSPEHETVLIRVHDYQPYFYAALPNHDFLPAFEDLPQLQDAMNSRMPPEVRIQQLQTVDTRPIMYYRPTAPAGSTFLRILLKPGSNVKKAATLFTKWAEDGTLANWGWQFADSSVHEADVKLITRFLCDSSLSGGSWLLLPSPVHPACTAFPPATATSTFVTATTSTYTLVPEHEHVSSCHIEVIAPWRALQSLTPDATQLSDPSWKPEAVQQLEAQLAVGGMAGHLPGTTTGYTGLRPAMPAQSVLSTDNHVVIRPGQHFEASHASSFTVPGQADSLQVATNADWHKLLSLLHAAQQGLMVPLKLLTLDALLATHDGSQRTATPSKDPIVCIACTLALSQATTSEQHNGEKPQQVAFVLTGSWSSQRPLLHHQGARIQCYSTEAELLTAWKDWVLAVDPDVIVSFQVQDTLGAIKERFAQQRIDGGGVLISRLAPRHRPTSPMTVKSVVMYSPNWVREQRRMASTSNQETFRVDVEGRLVFDVLRQVLSSQSLASFSLVDCVQSILGQTLEVLPAHQLAALHQQARGCLAGQPSSINQPSSSGGHQPSSNGCTSNTAFAAAVRLATHSFQRVKMVSELMERLATLPEAFEMARVTGLTLPQVMYNAQMIRTWSLLHRNAHRQGYIVAGRQEAGNLIESPYLMHPIENQTAGLYRQPVATLDFASLYPSLYRAYNLCYTTLVHPEDVAAVGRENCIMSPTGHAFVKPEVRQGILPSILAALINARSKTREMLKGERHPATRAVLESRQKALKLTANALYGFTGAQASPLQCVPLADSCLALGAASCRKAIEVMQKIEAEQQLGALGKGARVIYAQTDSLFVLFPNATPEQAVGLAKKAAQLVSAQFPHPIELKYERVMRPFLLLHVNRYAGRSYETEAQAASNQGTLLVKGVKSMWRQSAPFVRGVLQGALERLLMQDSIPAAVSFVEGEVHRLLSGRVELCELIMTGGLWRVTGQQVAAAAAASDEPRSPGGTASSSAPADEDVRGPHASLAVRLTQRDPDRRFLLGERIPYVLIAGERLQDDAAEDPLLAAQQGLAPNRELYWTNKLQPPLKEIFAPVLSPQQMQSLLNGPHTLVRVDAFAGTEGGYGLGMTGRPGSRSKGGRQSGLGQFFKQTAKCLSCKQAIPSPSTPASQGGRGEPPLAPGLCSACVREDDRWAASFLSATADETEHELTLSCALVTCGHCHSGGVSGVVLCENGECPVLYQRYGGARRLAASHGRLQRILLSEPW